MAKIETLIKRRGETFKHNTDEILEAMSEVIDGVVSFLHLKEELAQGQLEWQGVQMDEEIILLIGIIKYPPGAKFATSQGEIMVVSEQTADYFTRILRMGLPIDLVNKGSKEDTMNFLSSIDKETEQDVEYVELPPDLAGVQDFNFDELTDEQKKALLVQTNDKAVH